MTLPGWAGPVLAALPLVVVIVLLWLKLRGKKPAVVIAGANLIIKWREMDAKHSRMEIDDLKTAAKTDQSIIDGLEEKLSTKKLQLDKGYKDSGLSAKEIAAQFAKLKL